MMTVLLFLGELWHCGGPHDTWSTNDEFDLYCLKMKLWLFCSVISTITNSFCPIKFKTGYKGKNVLVKYILEINMRHKVWEKNKIWPVI